MADPSRHLPPEWQPIAATALEQAHAWFDELEVSLGHPLSKQSRADYITGYVSGYISAIYQHEKATRVAEEALRALPKGDPRGTDTHEDTEA